jgi:hypothetical protein
VKVGDDALDAARYLIVSLSESLAPTPEEVARVFEVLRRLVG